MACNAKATTSAKLLSVQLDDQALRQLAADLFGVKPEALIKHDYGYSVQYDVVVSGKGFFALEQFKDDRGLRLGAPSVEQAAALETQLQAKAVPMQQAAILKKLAALGKLDNLKQKENGITVRLEINL